MTDKILDSLMREVFPEGMPPLREGNLSYQVRKLEKERDFFRNMTNDLLATLSLERNRVMLRGETEMTEREALEGLFEYIDTMKARVETRRTDISKPLAWKPKIYSMEEEDE